MSLSHNEIKCVSELFPYFSKEPIVFDVGSNKGEWTDLLIDQVKEIHLFEPNELLLHYTMVKYCDRKNVTYVDSAVGAGAGHARFEYFTNENNGLSNIIGNPKWHNLPVKSKTVDVISLDSYWITFCNSNDQIDFIKIDVEGAEWFVLQGMTTLFYNEHVKFVQIEYSEHYQVLGIKFTEIIHFVAKYGYKVLYFNGETFEDVKAETFVEDYRLDNFIIAPMDFTQNWNSEFKKNTKDLGKFEFVLEIGAFEGLTSCYICDNLLTPTGRMICVDPLEDLYTPESDEKTNSLFVGQYDRFVRNTKGKPIELIRKKSQDAYDDMYHYRFDFIYIDGDHAENSVYNDGKNCFQLCKVGGYILFDDYEWSEGTKRGIDSFLNSLPSNKMTYEIRGNQVLCHKHENLD